MDRQWYRSQWHIHGKMMSEKGVTCIFIFIKSHCCYACVGFDDLKFYHQINCVQYMYSFSSNLLMSHSNYLLHGYQLYLGFNYTFITELMSYMFNLTLCFLDSLTVTSLTCGNLDLGKILSKSRWLPWKCPSTGEISSFPTEELPSYFENQKDTECLWNSFNPKSQGDRPSSSTL